MGAGDSFPGVKGPEREADYSPPYSAVVKNDGRISPLRLFKKNFNSMRNIISDLQKHSNTDLVIHTALSLY
jgi:hypothetical protein